MSAHQTTFQPHVCWRGASCETKLEVHCACGFAQGAIGQAHADAIARGHVDRPDLPCISWRPPSALDAIAQKIYEERYVDPKNPETAAYMRDGMIREVVQRTLELTALADSLPLKEGGTPAQRVASAAWLRTQVTDLIRTCEEHLAEDQALADSVTDIARDRYLARIENDRLWKRQLERILRGSTIDEALRDPPRKEGPA